MEKIYDVVIIGGGPGGYTSAMYCARAGLSTMVLENAVCRRADGTHFSGLIIFQDLRKELMDLALQKRWSRAQNALARRQSLRKC